REKLDIFQTQGIAQPTLRAMFYALYSLGIIPNTKSAYTTLSRITARAREEGQLPIDCFADQSRQVIRRFDDEYESPEDYIERGILHLANASTEYRKAIPRWYEQPEYVEVWIEKMHLQRHSSLSGSLNLAAASSSLKKRFLDLEL